MTLFAICGLYGAFWAHPCVKPEHIFLGDSSMDPLGQSHDVHLVGPYPQARRNAAV